MAATVWVPDGTLIATVFEPDGPLKLNFRSATRPPSMNTVSWIELLFALGKFVKLKVTDVQVIFAVTSLADATELPSATAASPSPTVTNRLTFRRVLRAFLHFSLLRLNEAAKLRARTPHSLAA